MINKVVWCIGLPIRFALFVILSLLLGLFLAVFAPNEAEGLFFDGWYGLVLKREK